MLLILKPEVQLVAFGHCGLLLNNDLCRLEVYLRLLDEFFWYNVCNGLGWDDE